MRKYTNVSAFSLKKKCVFLIPKKVLYGWAEPGQGEQKYRVLVLGGVGTEVLSPYLPVS